jgi:hypothetical protein
MTNKYINVYNPKNKNFINVEKKNNIETFDQNNSILEKIDINDSKCHIWNYDVLYYPSSEPLEDRVKKAWDIVKKKSKYDNTFFPAVIYNKSKPEEIMAIKCNRDSNTFISDMEHKYGSDWRNKLEIWKLKNDTGKKTECKNDEYQLKDAVPPLDDTICMKCSVCPDNTKIKQDCSKNTDIKCCSNPDNSSFINQDKYNCDWQCNNGFFKKDNKCIKCTNCKTKNSYLGETCTPTLDTVCEDCFKPENSAFINKNTCEWKCNKHFFKNSDKCDKCIPKPDNSTYTDKNECEWKCNKKFQKKDNKYCISCTKPENSIYSNEDTCEWECKEGYFKKNDKCIKCKISCNDNQFIKKKCSSINDLICEDCDKPLYSHFLNKSNCDWRCDAGYYLHNNKCTTQTLEFKKKILDNKMNILKLFILIILYFIYLKLKNNMDNIIDYLGENAFTFIELCVVSIIIKIFIFT